MTETWLHSTHLGFTFLTREDAESFVAAIDRDRLGPGVSVLSPEKLFDVDDPAYYCQPGVRSWNVELALTDADGPDPHELADEILTPIAERFGGECNGT